MSTKKSRKKRYAIVEFVEEEPAEDTEEVKKSEPLLWSNFPYGFKIVDILPEEFNEALEFIKKHYIENDILCSNVNLKDDSDSLESYMEQTLFRLKDKCSICAKHNETGEMAGILLLRVLHVRDFGKIFSRVKLKRGEAYKKICNLEAHLNRKTDIFTQFECDKFLRYYLICVHPKYRKRGVGLQLMRAGVDVARSLGLEVVMGIFDNQKQQIKARKIGMDVVYEIYYVDWVENFEMVFDDPGPGNYTVALMAGQVPSLE